MATWSDAGLVLLGAAIGGASTFGTSLLQRRHIREDRKETERQARIERVARVVGRIQTFLVDANPDRFVTLGVPDVRKISDRWEPLREELAILAAQEPASALRVAMARIDVQVANLLHAGLPWIVSPEIRERLGGGADHYTNIKQFHQDAEEAARIVLALVHGGGNKGATRPPETARDVDAAAGTD